MTVWYWIAGVLALAQAVYLVWALLNAEDVS